MIMCVMFAVIEFTEVFIVCCAQPSSDVLSASASTRTDDSKTRTEAKQLQKPQQTTEQSTVKSRSQSMAEVMQIQQQTLDAVSELVNVENEQLHVPYTNCTTYNC